MDGREERIRTSGLLLPKQALYQAELPPDEGFVDGMDDHAGGAPPAGKLRHREGLLTVPWPVKRALSGRTPLLRTGGYTAIMDGPQARPGDAANS